LISSKYILPYTFHYNTFQYSRNIFLSVIKFLDTLAKPFRCNKASFF